ncbi:lytic transglycosylase domain-containing protein [Paenibacillus sp. TH7-28]
MQIDPRTLGQLIQLQTMNGLDLQGTSVGRTAVDTDGSLFDILLQEMMSAEQGEMAASSLPGYLPASGLDLSEVLAMLSPSTVNMDYADATPMEPVHTSAVPIKAGDDNIEALIARASRTYGVPESLIKAVIDTESSFNPMAVSSAGAKGLMQLMDGTARGLGISDPFDPAQNIDGGTRYLSNQLSRFGGELKTALAAYNAGPGRLQRLGISNDEQLMEKLHMLPQETQNYIRKILTAQTKYEV